MDEPAFPELPEREFDDDYEAQNPYDDGLSYGVFSCMPAIGWLHQFPNRPQNRMNFDRFWLDRELGIFFGDTGLGKSMLAVQIGASLAAGTPIEPLGLGVPRRRVLYLDFEMNAHQFRSRYTVERPDGPSDAQIVERFPFTENLFRAQFEPYSLHPKFRTYDEYLIASLELLLEKYDPEVLIADNITYLMNSYMLHSPALNLMRTLKNIKESNNLSILVLAHTMKRRFAKPLTVDDMQGSKLLANFADSIFAIGESRRGSNIRYLKQIKTRSSELKFDESGVCAIKMAKIGSFLGFSFLDVSPEFQHVAEPPDERARKLLIEKVAELSRGGRSMKQIANELGLSKTTIARYLSK